MLQHENHYFFHTERVSILAGTLINSEARLSFGLVHAREKYQNTKLILHAKFLKCRHCFTAYIIFFSKKLVCMPEIR
jgi:hypothetical protein